MARDWEDDFAGDGVLKWRQARILGAVSGKSRHSVMVHRNWLAQPARLE